MSFQHLQKQVKVFHHECGCPAPDSPTKLDLNQIERRKSLIREEVGETLEALMQGSMPEVVDGVIDSIYVLVGTLVEMGVDGDEIWEAVHAANMRKFGPGSYKREDGKWIKPPDFVPPDVKGLIEKQKEASAKEGI